MEMGVETDRSNEVIEHYRKKVPNLFQSDVLIDENNFIMALALGRLLKAKGEYRHSDYLFKESLKIAQIETSHVPQNKENNWEGRIYLAMGNNEASLASFIKLVEEGIYSDQIVRDPVYQPLYGEPEFQRGMEIMKTRLEEERAIVKQMEARGELDIPPLPDN
jgi:tetratricopeptide (TPR) repeat protein